MTTTTELPAAEPAHDDAPAGAKAIELTPPPALDYSAALRLEDVDRSRLREAQLELVEADAQRLRIAAEQDLTIERAKRLEVEMERQVRVVSTRGGAWNRALQLATAKYGLDLAAGDALDPRSGTISRPARPATSEAK